MGSSTEANAELRTRVRQQEIVAELGQQALETDDLDRLMDDASAAVAAALDADFGAVLEFSPDGNVAVLRHGVGWREGLVGATTVPTGPDSQVGYTRRRGGFVLVDDLRTDDRFSGPELLADHGVISGISATVGPVDDPWGVLGIYTTQRRAFTEHDADFVRSVANVLASAVENERAQSELEGIYGRISDAFFALDEEWRFTHLNERAHEVINPEGRTLVGERVWEAFPAAVERKFKEQYERAMREQETVSFEEYYPEPLDAWFEVRAYPSETGLSVYFRDVTERRLAQRRLEEERDMFAEGPVVVFRWKNEEGWPVEYVSENVEDVLGYAPADLVSGDVPYTDLLLEEEIDRIAGEVERNSDGTTERFSHEPYRVRTEDGDVRWVKDTTKVLRDETGDVTHYLGYLVDITERKERERELSRYETIVEAVNDGVYVVDEDERFTMVNEAYAEMLGYDRDELIGEHVSVVVDDDVLAEARRTEAAMRDDEVDDPVVEAELEAASGERVPLEATFAMLPDAGDGEHRVGVVRDVSERKDRERELQRTERRFEAIFEDPNILVGLLEPDGTVLDINRTAMEYIDADLEEVTDQPFWETPWWGEGDEVRANVRRWVERAAAGEYVDFETDLTRPDGQRYTLNGVFRPVTNEEGDVVSVIVSDRDVTERKERERALEQSEQRYRTLAEHFPNGIVTLFDDDLRYTLAAGQAFEDLPVSRKVVEDRTPREAWGDEVADVLEPVLRAALDGEEDSVELSYTGREWLVHAVPITDERGNVFAGMTMTQDITQRKENQRKLEATVDELEESNERLENFAGMLAHELRNPVTIGQIYSQQLPEESAPEAVEHVTDAFDRIEAMIDIVLVLTRGREAVGERTPMGLAAVARETWAGVDAPDATLETPIDHTIRADETYVRHLFRNLFENAVQHGGSDVTVTVGGLPTGFYVADDGPGIPADERDAVFEEGYTTAAGKGGTGIGLAFVQDLADVYEWEYTVRESAAGGARFEFTNVDLDPS